MPIGGQNKTMTKKAVRKISKVCRFELITFKNYRNGRL